MAAQMSDVNLVMSKRRIYAEVQLGKSLALPFWLLLEFHCGGGASPKFALPKPLQCNPAHLLPGKQFRPRYDEKS